MVQDTRVYKGIMGWYQRQARRIKERKKSILKTDSWRKGYELSMLRWQS